VEVAERAGCRAALVEDAGAILPELLTGTRRVGLTAGASAPEELVESVVSALGGLGAVTVSERVTAREDVRFILPPMAARRRRSPARPALTARARRRVPGGAEAAP